MKEKVLILGGTEFVGRQLVEKLLEDEQYELFLFNRGKTNAHLFPGVKRIIGDRQTASIKQLADHQWSYVIDFSSYETASLVNTLQHINRDVKHYIYISTVSVYDLKVYTYDFPIAEDFAQKSYTSAQIANPTHLAHYGEKKVACEAIIKQASWLKSTILRPSLIIGKYDPTERFYYWLRKVQLGGNILMPNSASSKLSLTFADDFTQIIFDALKGLIPKGVYNCSTLGPQPVIDMIMEMKTQLKSTCTFTSVDAHLLQEQAVQLPLLYGGNILIDQRKLEAAIDWELTPYEEALRRIIDHYRKEDWPVCKAGISEAEESALLDKYHFESK